MNGAPIRLGRAFATVGGWTMASRVLGFVRDVMIAALLGAGASAEAFFVAFRLPNMFRRLFAEGAFNMAFVPLFAKRLEGEGLEEARSFAEQVLSILLVVLLLITLLAQLAMPWLVYMLAAGFADDPQRFDLAVIFGRIAFPYLLFMSMTAMFSGALNALGQFAAAAAAPVLLNVVLISAMALASALGWEIGLALSWGVAIAGAAQVALVWRAAEKAGLSLRLRAPKITPGVKRLVKLGVPGALAGGVLQINLLIGTLIASFFDGAVAWLNYADRIYQLPLGVVGVAIGVVLLPELSRKVRAGDGAGARASMSRAAEFAIALTLPAAVALAVIPGPVVSVLFERGAFTASDAASTAAALAIFAFGLPAFVLQKVVQPAYFAREDTVTPLKIAAVSMVANTVLSVGLAPALGYLAIPIGTSVAGWVNIVLLQRGARRFGEEAMPDDRLRRRAPRIALASLAMGAAVWAASLALAPALDDSGLRIAALAALVIGGGAIYGLAGRILGAFEVKELLHGLKRGP